MRGISWAWAHFGKKPSMTKTNARREMQHWRWRWTGLRRRKQSRLLIEDAFTLRARNVVNSSLRLERTPTQSSSPTRLTLSHIDREVATVPAPTPNNTYDATFDRRTWSTRLTLDQVESATAHLVCSRNEACFHETLASDKGLWLCDKGGGKASPIAFEELLLNHFTFTVLRSHLVEVSHAARMASAAQEVCYTG